MNISRRIFRVWPLAITLVICQQVHANRQQGSKEEVDRLYATGLKFLVAPDSLIKYAEPGYQMARAIGYRFGEGSHLKLKGVYEHRKGNLDQAIQYYGNALAIFTDLKDDLEIGKLNLNIATSYNTKSDFVKGAKYALEALKSFERINFASGKGRVLNLLGIIAYSQNDFTTAKSYFLQYNALVKQAKDTVEIASSYNNLGSVYKDLRKPDSAIYYLRLAASIHQKKGNINGLGVVYENMGTIALDVKGDFRAAATYYRRSIAAYNSIGADQRAGHGYLNLGIAYAKLKDTIQAKKYMERAVAMAKDAGDKEILQKGYEELSKLDAGNEQYKAAYEKLRSSLSHADSIWTKDKVRAVEELKTIYDTEKKEMQISALNQQNTIQQLEIRQRNYLLLIGSGLFLAAALIGYLAYSRQRLKSETRLQLEVNKQQDAAAKAVLTAEERERQRIAADLHDGVGQLLSTALLSMNAFLKKLSLNDPEELQAQRTVSLITESYNEVRSISHQMIPNALLKSGLVSAVRDFLENVNSEQLNVNLSVSGLADSLGEQTETILYRIMQEAVNNVIKYARASKLQVQLVKDNDGLTLSVEDNGTGFDVDRAMKSDGIGLRNIISRTKFLKGTVDFDSKPGKGTLMLLFIPATLP